MWHFIFTYTTIISRDTVVFYGASAITNIIEKFKLFFHHVHTFITCLFDKHWGFFTNLNSGLFGFLLVFPEVLNDINKNIPMKYKIEFSVSRL